MSDTKSFFHSISKKDIEKKKNRTAKYNPLHDLYFANIGIYMVVPIFLGLTLGLVLDNLLRVRPTLTVVFLFLGTLSSFYNMYKIVREYGGKNTAHKHKS